MSRIRFIPYATFFALYACTSSTATPPPIAGDGGSTGTNASSSARSSQTAGGGGSSSQASGGSGGSGNSSSATAVSDGGSSVATGGGDSGAGCAGLPLCDDFESDMLGQPPNQALWTTFGLAGCEGLGNPNATAVFSITVDNKYANSGTQSVKIDTSQAGSSSGCGPWLVNTSAFSQLTGGDVYGRFYVHLSDTTTTVPHVAMMALGLDTDGGIGFDVQNADSFLSLASLEDGFPSNTLAWIRSDGNGTLPPQGPTGESTYPSATGFTCIEFHTTASTGAIQTWVNGTLIAGLTDPPAPTGLMKWILPSPLTTTSLGFGWQVYTGPNLTVWIDDVALSTTRIGCS